MNYSHHKSIRLAILISFGLLLVACLSTPSVPESSSSRTVGFEQCLSCHNGIEPISPSHSAQEFGCVSCHGGNPLAQDSEAAHSGMVRNPGALDVAEQYCGECHASQVALTTRSTMATYAGAIALVRRTFGQQADEKAHFAIREIGHLPAFTISESDPQPMQKFGQNCLSCHLYAEPLQADYYHRSTGCSSCHVLYANDGLYQGNDPTIPKDEAGHPMRHEFTLAIPYTQCNHCHNRGNYNLRTMTFLERDDLPPLLEGGEGVLGGEEERELKRRHEYYQPIGQFTLCEWELDCIDCHTAQEVMGNGQLHDNRSQAQYVTCATCHGTLDAPPSERVIESESDIAMLRAQLNPLVELELGTSIITTSRGEPFWHVQRQGDSWLLTGKATGIKYEMPLVTGSACQQQPDQQESHYCHQCHAYER